MVTTSAAIYPWDAPWRSAKPFRQRADKVAPEGGGSGPPPPTHLLPQISGALSHCDAHKKSFFYATLAGHVRVPGGCVRIKSTYASRAFSQ